MKKYLLPLAFLSFVLIGCSDDDSLNNEPAEEGPIVKVDFPNVDNTQAMNVSSNLSVPTNTNVKLDSLKMYYYSNYHYNENGPGMSYRNQINSTPAPVINSNTQYFTYDTNGFVSERTIRFNTFYTSNDVPKVIFKYNYTNQNTIESIVIRVLVNEVEKYNEEFLYDFSDEQNLFNTIQRNNFNIESFANATYVTPKNVYNAERNMFPSQTDFQFLYSVNTSLYEILSDLNADYEFSYNYLMYYNYINTHCTFVKTINDNGLVEFPLANIQYKVREDHYPEIIQYGDPYTGGFRYLYYYQD